MALMHVARLEQGRFQRKILVDLKRFNFQEVYRIQHGNRDSFSRPLQKVAPVHPQNFGNVQGKWTHLFQSKVVHVAMAKGLRFLPLHLRRCAFRRRGCRPPCVRKCLGSPATVASAWLRMHVNWGLPAFTSPIFHGKSFSVQ